MGLVVCRRAISADAWRVAGAKTRQAVILQNAVIELSEDKHCFRSQHEWRRLKRVGVEWAAVAP